MLAYAFVCRHSCGCFQCDCQLLQQKRGQFLRAWLNSFPSHSYHLCSCWEEQVSMPVYPHSHQHLVVYGFYTVIILTYSSVMGGAGLLCTFTTSIPSLARHSVRAFAHFDTVVCFLVMVFLDVLCVFCSEPLHHISAW